MGLTVLNDVCMTVENSVAIVKITRESKRNALNSEVLHQLCDCFDEISGRRDLRVVIITGAGTRAFAAGADLGEIPEKQGEGELREYYGLFDALYRKMAQIPQPIIARVNGYAMGGGCLLAFAADLVVATEQAVFSQPEVNFGFTGGAALLPRLIGRHRAAEITMLGARITAQEAYQMGLANRVVADEEALNRTVEEMSEVLLKKSPPALAAIKSIMRYTYDHSLTDSGGYETEASVRCLQSEESRKAIRGFLNRA